MERNYISIKLLKIKPFGKVLRGVLRIKFNNDLKEASTATTTS